MGAFDTMFGMCTNQVFKLYPDSFSGNWTSVSRFCTLLTTVVASNHKTTGVLDFEDITPFDVGWWVNGLTCTVIAFLTVSLNSVSIWIFTRRSTRSPTNLLLAIVSAIDLLTCVLQVPLQVHVYLRSGYKHLPSRAWCDVYNYLYNFLPATLHSTAFLLNMCLSVQRCVGVKDVQRFHLKAICSYKGTLVSIAVCVTASLTVHALYPITIGVEDVEAIGKEMMQTGELRFVQSCRVSPRHPEAYDVLMSTYIWGRVAMLQTIPAVVLGVCNTVLITASFRVYTYRRRLIGKLGGIASLRNACAPDVEAFKRFGDGSENRESVKGKRPAEVQRKETQIIGKPAMTEIRRRSFPLERLNHVRKVNLSISAISTREQKLPPVLAEKPKKGLFKLDTNSSDNDGQSENGLDGVNGVSILSCKTMGKGSEEFGFWAEEDVIRDKEDKISWWEFLRENISGARLFRDQEKNITPICGNDILLNVEANEIENTESSLNVNTSELSYKSSTVVTGYEHNENIEFLSLQDVNTNLQTYNENVCLIGVCSEQNSNTSCLKTSQSLTNLFKSANDSPIDNGRYMFKGEGHLGCTNDTRGLSERRFHSALDFCGNKYTPKTNAQKVATFPSWLHSKSEPPTAPSSVFVIKTEMEKLSTCKSHATNKENLIKEDCSNQIHALSITHHKDSPTAGKHYTGATPRGSTNVPIKTENPTERASATYPSNGELRSTVMLVLVTSLTLLAELFVIIMLIFQFLDSIALKQKKFISTSQLAVMFSLSNLVTLLTFPLNFFIFCGLSCSFRDALRDEVRRVLALFKKVLRRS